MSDSRPARTPWEFRLRAFFIAIAFGLGFFLGYPLQAMLFGNNSLDPTFVMLGRPFGPAGIVAAGWLAAALVILAWLVRLWGSSYHSAGVVMSGDVVTDTLTFAGPYRYVRNPLYFGNILLALGIGLLGPPIATLLVFALNLWFMLRLVAIEERFLRESQGAAYERYCAAVPRLLPRLTPAPLPEDPRKPNFAYGFFTELFALGFAIAMVYVALSVPRGGGGKYTFLIFWAIAGGAILLQILLSSVSRRAGERQP